MKGFNELKAKVQSLTEQCKQLQVECTKRRHLLAQKDSDIAYLKRAKEELSKALAEERKLLLEVMQEVDTRVADMSGSRERATRHF